MGQYGGLYSPPCLCFLHINQQRFDPFQRMKRRMYFCKKKVSFLHSLWKQNITLPPLKFMPESGNDCLINDENFFYYFYSTLYGNKTIVIKFLLITPKTSLEPECDDTPSPPETSTSSNHFTFWPVIN